MSLKSMSKIKKLLIYKNWAFQKVKDRYSKQRLGSVGRHNKSLTEVVKDYDLALVHAGLKSIKAVSATDASHSINEKLKELKAFAVPAFTPSFRNSGIFSVPFSWPEVGAYSKINHKTFSFRTHDPIHSLYIYGNTQSFLNTLNDTFHSDGIYSNFCKERSCWINIGTHHIVSTVFHYIERLAQVPYLKNIDHNGVIYTNKQDYKEVKHINYKHSMRVAWNRKKIEKTLLNCGCIIQGYWNGAHFKVIDGQKATEILLDKLKKDPYFLVC